MVFFFFPVFGGGAASGEAVLYSRTFSSNAFKAASRAAPLVMGKDFHLTKFSTSTANSFTLSREGKPNRAAKSS